MLRVRSSLKSRRIPLRKLKLSSYFEHINRFTRNDPEASLYGAMTPIHTLLYVEQFFFQIIFECFPVWIFFCEYNFVQLI